MDQQLLRQIIQMLSQKAHRIPWFLQTFQVKIRFQIAVDHQFHTNRTEFYSLERFYREYASTALLLSTDQVDEFIASTDWHTNSASPNGGEFQAWYYRRHVPPAFKRLLWFHYAKLQLLHFLYW
jgi:hypothetical protein